MSYRDLRDFLALLEKDHLLKRISPEIDPVLEITEICDRTLRKQGPALLFENIKNHRIPVLANLFGTEKRIALAMGGQSKDDLREIGRVLASLKQPDPPKGFKDALESWPMLKQVIHMAPKTLKHGKVQDCVMQAVNLNELPIQTCWPDDAGPLITWGLTVTQGPNKSRHNLGIYRQQVIAEDKLIMRWLPHRGGALDYQDWLQKNPDTPFPVSVVLGADPASLLAAVTPIPDTISEHAFSGLLRGSRTELVKCQNNDLLVPAKSEFVLEGHIHPGETAREGPFGDHTGYYNEVESFPVMTVEKITHRENPIYHSTYTGKPPDEPAVLGLALNEVFVPILQTQFPEIEDFFLPAEACSYRLAIVSIRKQYSGHARRILMGVWSYLRQFMYTKFVIVVDDDINIRDWKEVIWALSTRVDPERDTLLVNNTAIDYLDFASPVSGLGSKMGIDATNKWPGETNRVWGKPILMKSSVKTHIDSIWESLGIE